VPARFLSASASPSLLDASLILDPIPECGCTGDRCRFVYVYDDFTSCYGNPCDAIRQADEVLCTNSKGKCFIVDIKSMPCLVVEDGYRYTHNCPYADVISCAAASSPSPTPSPTPTPTPEDCNPNTRPNPNCSCQNLPGIGYTWICNCNDGSKPADYTAFPQTGGCDPSKSFNGGNNCCRCVNQSPTCELGPVWNNFSCQCEAVPVITPTGTPSDLSSSCTEYYWVLYDCFPSGNSLTCYEVARWYAGCW
jgi:hypothetical protein